MTKILFVIITSCIIAGCTNFSGRNSNLNYDAISYVVIYRTKFKGDNDMSDAYKLFPITGRILIKHYEFENYEDYDCFLLFRGYNFKSLKNNPANFPWRGGFCYFVFYDKKETILFSLCASPNWKKSLSYIELVTYDKKYLTFKTPMFDVEFQNSDIYNFLMKLLHDNFKGKYLPGVG